MDETDPTTVTYKSRLLSPRRINRHQNSTFRNRTLEFGLMTFPLTGIIMIASGVPSRKVLDHLSSLLMLSITKYLVDYCKPSRHKLATIEASTGRETIPG
ncbi:13218_t:CDS:2 [Funneliformis mosseae]|uniref:13218_t:CDS:1 n=1 Tax=Funneliformis mosseae TaxID=27381 RepID=A0A9N9GVW6_FUNMO|nr:13218_t:CDS:2 [Funneliformis mosseae]